MPDKYSAAENFYVESLKLLNASKIPYMVGGTFAVKAYTQINRFTKDLDVFCKAGDFPKILDFFSARGFKAEATDERWLAKIRKRQFYMDIVFNMANTLAPVTDEWIKQAQTKKILGVNAKVLPPTELILSKVFIQDRGKYEGSDVAHLILLENKNIDWKRLLSYLEQYWEVLLIHLLNFRFIYPSEREAIPFWLIDELLKRLDQQIITPTSSMKVCRGRIFSRGDYAIDILEWGFADLIGAQDEYATYKQQKK